MADKIALIFFYFMFIISCQHQDNNHELTRPDLDNGNAVTKRTSRSMGGQKVPTGHEFVRSLNKTLEGPKAPCIGCESNSENNSENRTPFKTEETHIDPATLSANERKLFQNYKKLGGDPRAFKQAMCFYKANNTKRFHTKGPGYPNGIRIDNKRYITINDLTKPSSDKRLFILDKYTGEVTAYQSSHGRGRPPNENNREAARHFSNTPGSNATPTGFFITGNRYVSDKSWRTGMRLHGLQRGINDNAISRGVVMHKGEDRRGTVYTSGGEAKSSEARPRLRGNATGRTEGCTAVDPRYADSIMSRIQGGVEGRRNNDGGSLYYNYSPNEKNKGDNYCGDNLVSSR